jgi:hypothetical protein
LVQLSLARVWEALHTNAIHQTPRRREQPREQRGEAPCQRAHASKLQRPRLLVRGDRDAVADPSAPPREQPQERAVDERRRGSQGRRARQIARRALLAALGDRLLQPPGSLARHQLRRLADCASTSMW